MRRDGVISLIVVILVLTVLAAKSLLIQPAPLLHRAGEFDATAAKARLAFILGDQRPHPADSIGDDLVRGRLITSLRALGMQPIVRDQLACNDFAKARVLSCARVRNVIATIGPAKGKALLLNAHYDSVPVGPGASDDGIGVATLLETGAILKGRALPRPVILLFNEGEELGLVGARAFLTDPLSRNVDSLLNFDSRGVTGPVTMFETSQPNGAAMTAYARSANRKFASSLSTDVARIIPNDTDATVFKDRNWLTLNSAIVGNETRYHSPGDTLEGLDLRSLQDMGDEALGLASSLSPGLPTANGNRIFFDLATIGFIVLPLTVGVVWLVVIVVLLGVATVRSQPALRAILVILAMVVGGCALAWLALTIMGDARPGNYWRAHPEVAYIAIYATMAAGELVLLAVLARKLATDDLRVAYWLVFVVLGAVVGLLAPGAIIYFLLPPICVLFGSALGRQSRIAPVLGAVAALFLLYVTWGELLGALEELFTPGPLWVVEPAAAILITPVLIEISAWVRRSDKRVLYVGLVLIALGSWAVAAATPAYSEDHQQPFTIEHVTYVSGNSFWSILNDGARLPTEYAKLGSWHQGRLDFSARRRWLAQAQSLADTRPPQLEPVETARTRETRTIQLRIHANGAERISIIVPSGAHLIAAGWPGFVRPIADAQAGADFTISCTGRSCDGTPLTLEMRNDGQVEFTVVGARNGLPPAAAPLVRARPQFSRPQYVPDETVAVTKFTV